MPIEFNNIISGFFNFINSISFINNIFNSTLYTSILLGIIIILIVSYAGKTKRRHRKKLSFKIIVYIFIATFIVLYIKESVLRQQIKQEVHEHDITHIINDKTGGMIYKDETVEVKPNYRKYRYTPNKEMVKEDKLNPEALISDIENM